MNDNLRDLEFYILCDNENNDELWAIYWNLKKFIDTPKHETVEQWEKREKGKHNETVEKDNKKRSELLNELFDIFNIPPMCVAGSLQHQEYFLEYLKNYKWKKGKEIKYGKPEDV